MANSRRNLTRFEGRGGGAEQGAVTVTGRKDTAPFARVRCGKGTESRGRQCLQSLSQGHLWKSGRGFE